MKKRRVVWTIKAVESLNDYCHFIAQHSSSAAKKVKTEIVQATRKLESNPELYQLDEFRSDESRNVRRFFKWSYKIVYELFENEVVILNIYHTAQNPSSMIQERKNE